MSSKEKQKTSPTASYPGHAREPARSRDRYSRLSSACVQEDSSETNSSTQGQQSPSVSLSKQDDTGNLNSLLHVVSELKQIDLTTTLDDYKELKDDLKNKTKQLQQAEKKLEVTQTESNRLRARLQQAEKEREKYKADLKLKTEELQQTIDPEPQPTCIKSETPPDLSDPMRPLKIAEKYNELYDNEWTDAMEILGESEKNEQINVQILLEILKKCYRFCADLAEKQMESLEMALVHPTDDKPKHTWEKPKLTIPKSIHKQLKDCRKEMSTMAIYSIKQEQLTGKLGLNARNIPKFVSKCIEICWFMCVLDPPVVLGDKASVGTTFDTNIYKTYTNSGTVVAYNVWPPLLLRQNGSLLVKGIVQPVKLMKKITTARMDANGMRDTKAIKDPPDYSNTYSTQRHDRLTGDVEYGHCDAGYDPMVDAYDRHEPVTYGRRDPVTKLIKTYDQSTGNGGLDHFGDVYGRRDPVTKPKVSRTDTLWKEHKPSSYYNRSRANVNSYDHGKSQPTTNYVQENVDQFSPEKLVYKNGVTYIELKGQLYDYELYKRIFGKLAESQT